MFIFQRNPESLRANAWQALPLSTKAKAITGVLVCANIIPALIATACYSKEARKFTGLSPKTYAVISLQTAFSFLLTTDSLKKIQLDRLSTEGKICSYELFSIAISCHMLLFLLMQLETPPDVFTISLCAVSLLSVCFAGKLAYPKIQNYEDPNWIALLRPDEELLPDVNNGIMIEEGWSKKNTINTAIATLSVISGVALTSLFCYSKEGQKISGLTENDYQVINLQMTFSLLLTTFSLKTIKVGRFFFKGEVQSYEFLFVAIGIQNIAFAVLALNFPVYKRTMISLSTSLLMMIGSLFMSTRKLRDENNHTLSDLLRIQEP